MKYDDNKPPHALIPPECLTQVAEVLGYGANKYGAHNWRDDLNSTTFSRTYSSIQRHLNAYWAGEDNDQESGLSHLAHAATQVFILMTQAKHGQLMDDRYKQNNENS